MNSNERVEEICRRYGIHLGGKTTSFVHIVKHLVNIIDVNEFCEEKGIEDCEEMVKRYEVGLERYLELLDSSREFRKNQLTEFSFKEQGRSVLDYINHQYSLRSFCVLFLDPELEATV